MNNIPKNIEKRNEYGLLDIDYHFNEDSSINWKAMVDPKFIYVNPSNKAKMTAKYGKLYEELKPIEDKIEDVDLVIMLAGIKQLLKYRGFKSLKYDIKESNENYAAVSCSIIFVPNFESQMEQQEFSDNACAHFGNCNGFGQKYLLEMATNRSMCRTVRSYLNLNIVSKEEIFDGSNIEQDNSPKIPPQKQVNMLKDLMTVKKVTFEHIVTKLKNEKKWDEKYTSIEKLPADIIFELLSRIKEYKV